MVINDPTKLVKVSRQSAVESEVESPRPKMRQDQISLVITICGLVLVLGGSGGVLAELYHTRQVFQDAQATYAKDAHDETQKGIGDILTKISNSESLALSATGAAQKEAEQIAVSSSAQIAAISQEAGLRGAPILAQSWNLHHAQDGAVHRWAGILEDEMLAFEEEMRRTQPEGSSFKIEFRFRTIDPSGVVHRQLLEPRWNGRLNTSLLLFECIRIPGYTSDSCTVDEAPVEMPADVTVAPQQGDTLVLKGKELSALFEYRRRLEELERVLFYNHLDVERSIRSNPSAPKEYLDDIFSEASRTESGLRNVQARSQQVAEILRAAELASSITQPPSVFCRELAESSLSRDFSQPNFVGRENSCDAVRSWVSDILPKFREQVELDRKMEWAVRRSVFYHSIRPLLANILETGVPITVSGRKAGHIPGRISGQFDKTTADSEIAEVSVWPTIIISGVFFSLLAFLIWKKFRPEWNGFTSAALVLIPVALILLLFPVRMSWALNTATRSIADEIIAKILGQRINSLYANRAAKVEADTVSSGQILAASIRSRAHARGDVRIRTQEIQKSGQEDMLRAQPAFYLQTMRGYQIMTDWVYQNLPGSDLKFSLLGHLEKAQAQWKDSDFFDKQ